MAFGSKSLLKKKSKDLITSLKWTSKPELEDIVNCSSGPLSSLPNTIFEILYLFSFRNEVYLVSPL